MLPGLSNSAAQDRARGARLTRGGCMCPLEKARSLLATALAGGAVACGGSDNGNVEPTGVGAALAIAAVSPASGPLAGGTPITITGTNFSNIMSVTVGG